MRDFQNRVVVVTGGASGIGKSIAARFAKAGAHVVIADIEDSPLQAAAEELGAVGIRTDVSSLASVYALRDAVLERFGAVHLLCNNAGVGGAGMAVDLTVKDWQWVLGVNLWGVIHGIDAFLPTLMAQAEGHIVNTASIAGLIAYPRIPIHYNASKYAVVGISETLKGELAETNVGVSVLCPGFVRTNIRESQRNRPTELRNEKRNERGRAMDAAVVSQLSIPVIQPDEVAALVYDAVVADRFWIFTHPELMAAVEDRYAGVLSDAKAIGWAPS